MTRQRGMFSMPLLALLLGATGALLAPVVGLAQQSGGQSWTSSISSGFKSGVDKLGNMVSPKSAPKSDPKDDAVSLKSDHKPGPQLNVAVARLYMESNRLAEAEEQFKLALKTDPEYLAALLGYAQLQDQVDRADEALQLYQRAATLHPLQASVFNNMGLFYAKRGKPDEAIAALGRAVRLDPKNPRYRNNIAMVLMDQGRTREAFNQLRDVYKDAVAYYNMGYLLNKKGQTQAALQHFQLALKADPTMVPAERWIAYLHRTTTQTRLPQHPMAAGLRVTDDPMTRRMPNYGPRSGEPVGGDSAQMSPRRLPSPPGESGANGGAALPGISYERSTPPDAPMPPPRNPGVRPLPTVE